MCNTFVFGFFGGNFTAFVVSVWRSIVRETQIQCVMVSGKCYGMGFVGSSGVLRTARCGCFECGGVVRSSQLSLTAQLMILVGFEG